MTQHPREGKAHSQGQNVAGVTIEPLVPDPAKVRMPKMLVPGAVEQGAINEIFGEPGSGKSTYALLEAVALATGRGPDMIGKELVRSRVALLWTDESEAVMQAKVAALMLKHGIRAEDLHGWFHLIRTDSPLDAQNATVEHIGGTMKAGNVEVLYIDSLASNAPTAEMQNDEAGKLMNRLRLLSRNVGSVVFLHHVRKPYPGAEAEISLNAQRGASAIGAAVRTARQCVKRDGELAGDAALFLIETVKCSNAAKPPQAGFRIDGYRVNDAPTWAPVATRVDVAARRNPFDGIPHSRAVQGWNQFCDLPPEDRRSDMRATSWAGHGLAKVFNLPSDTKHEKTRLQAMLTAWLDTGHLRKADFWDGKQTRPVYERGAKNLADVSD